MNSLWKEFGSRSKYSSKTMLYQRFCYKYCCRLPSCTWCQAYNEAAMHWFHSPLPYSSHTFYTGQARSRQMRCEITFRCLWEALGVLQTAHSGWRVAELSTAVLLCPHSYAPAAGSTHKLCGKAASENYLQTLLSMNCTSEFTDCSDLSITVSLYLASTLSEKHRLSLTVNFNTSEGFLGFINTLLVLHVLSNIEVHVHDRHICKLYLMQYILQFDDSVTWIQSQAYFALNCICSYISMYLKTDLLTLAGSNIFFPWLTWKKNAHITHKLCLLSSDFHLVAWRKLLFRF